MPRGNTQFRCQTTLLSLVVLGLAVNTLLPQLTTLEATVRVDRGLSFWLPTLTGFALAALFQREGRALTCERGRPG